MVDVESLQNGAAAVEQAGWQQTFHMMQQTFHMMQQTFHMMPTTTCVSAMMQQLLCRQAGSSFWELPASGF